MFDLWLRAEIEYEDRPGQPEAGVACPLDDRSVANVGRIVAIDGRGERGGLGARAKDIGVDALSVDAQTSPVAPEHVGHWVELLDHHDRRAGTLDGG